MIDKKLFEELKQNLEEAVESIKDDDWDCGCPKDAEDKCVSVVCPRKH